MFIMWRPEPTELTWSSFYLSEILLLPVLCRVFHVQRAKESGETAKLGLKTQSDKEIQTFSYQEKQCEDQKLE